MIINLIIEDIKKVVLRDGRTMCCTVHFPIALLSTTEERKCGPCLSDLPHILAVRYPLMTCHYII